MHSEGTREFWRLYRHLPEHVRTQARAAYRFFAMDTAHPGLRFKCVDAEEQTYSARIGLQYRVLGTLEDGKIIWFWIGTHGEYDQLLR
jgi:hypothetical protein